jgi:leucyl aminopeptidase
MVVGGEMKVTFQEHDIFSARADGILLFTYEEGSDAESRLKTKLGGTVAVARERKEFEGKAKQVLIERQPGTPRFYVLIGMGKRASVNADTLRAGAGLGAETLRAMGAKTIAIGLPPEIEPASAGQAAAEGALLRTYQFTQYRTQKLDEIRRIESVIIMGDMKAAAGVERGRIIAESCNMVRDLQNTPSIDMTPQVVAERAARLAKEERFTCAILDRAKLAKQGYGGILSVGKGSSHEPRLVTIEYAPKGAKRTIAVVGKGVTFDTGGISIKPSPKMAEMKFDMSGAANVLGIMRNASRLKLPVRVIGVLCLAENMPDGNSYKPGDIVRTKSGKTIEIDNTDAEGRVVLADGLYHATTFKPDLIIDMATLTGACVVTFGDVTAAVLGNDQPSIDSIIAASSTCGEKVWQLPLWDEYAEDIKSQIADMKNMGMPQMAGSIAGAMLLKEFVGTTPWVHLDIAGVAYAQGRERYFTPYGGTAFGVRLVTEFLEGYRG